MIERLFAFLFKLGQYLMPGGGDTSFTPTDDMDSLPYIPDEPSVVIAEPRDESQDMDASKPTKRGIDNAQEAALAMVNHTIEKAGA